MKNFHLYLIVSTFILASCGGGGGGGGGSAPTTPTTPAPTVNLSADPTSVLLESTSTLTWSSTNATSCSASWTSQTGTSGSEAVTITTAGNNSFSISCTGDGGSGSASVTVEGYRETDGVVVDGYISGAEVFIDEDDDWVLDSNENSTTSDNEGKFTIRYANGNLVSIGGTDLDSQTLLDNLLITHKLTGHSDFKAVTPVTSIAAFMEDASLVNAALGIDSSIDVFTFDPVANKGDSGINDYLYEKGNQLTVLAFALQNITNNLNTSTETTQDYFKAITEEIEKEYTETETKVDIETEAFVTKALENVITAKSVTIDETAKANTTKALASILPVIEVKSSDDLTTGVIRFAVSTLQTDIQAIANGTATAETVSSYTEDILAYIAEDQNIDADEIAPDISAIADSASTSEDIAVEINVLLNDSYLTSSPISITAANGTHGTTSVASNVVTYDPDADFNGTDTFSYTITQGDKTSSADVTVSIEAVNDAPSIDIASTIQVAENQTAVTTVSVSDVDEDELTLTLGGTDADSFNLSDDNILTFKEEPDYETKTSYSINLSLTDGTETVTKDVTIAITNVNDIAPEFTSDATFSAAENQTDIGTVTATDIEDDTLTYSISGSDISIDSSTGVMTFNSAPDYETKSTYTASVTVSDGTNSTNQNIIINITDILENSEPIITNLKTQIELQEDDKKFLYTVEATDADGDTIYFQLTGDDANKFTLSSSGDLAFKEIPDYENPTDADTDNIYEINVSVTDIAPSSTSIMPAGKSDQIETNTSNNTEVRVTNFDEDIIGLTLTSIDGNDSTGPKIRLQLVIDSYTNPNSISILYQGPNAGQYWTGAGSPTTDNFKLTYDHTFTAPDSSPSGQWRIRTIRMQTDQGQIEHKQDFIINKGFTTTTDVYNPNSDTNKPQLESISEPVVQGNDSNPDTSITISFEITASDQENAYNRGHSRWESPASEGGWPYKGGWGSTDLSQNPPKTIFTASLDPKTVSGIYKFEDIRLYDKAGNRKMYYCIDYGDEGYKLRSEDYEIVEGAVCTVNIDNPIEDNSKPQLTKFVLTGSTNTEGRKIISHEYEIDNKTSWTDQETSLRRVYLRMSGPISYDIYDGNLPFKGDTLLPLDAPAGTYQVNYFFVTDNALNDNKYYKNEMDELGFTTFVTFD